MHKETSAVDGDTPICNGKLRCINVTAHSDTFVAPNLCQLCQTTAGSGNGCFCVCASNNIWFFTAGRVPQFSSIHSSLVGVYVFNLFPLYFPNRDQGNLTDLFFVHE